MKTKFIKRPKWLPQSGYSTSCFEIYIENYIGSKQEKGHMETRAINTISRELRHVNNHEQIASEAIYKLYRDGIISRPIAIKASKYLSTLIAEEHGHICLSLRDLHREAIVRNKSMVLISAINLLRAWYDDAMSPKLALSKYANDKYMKQEVYQLLYMFLKEVYNG